MLDENTDPGMPATRKAIQSSVRLSCMLSAQGEQLLQKATQSLTGFPKT